MSQTKLRITKFKAKWYVSNLMSVKYYKPWSIDRKTIKNNSRTIKNNNPKNKIDEKSELMIID